MTPKGMILGLGLIGIGREWGHVKSPVPTESQALAFLEAAWYVGMRFFDTAPAYGSSEARLGKFLHSLNAEEARLAVVATKAGEHWDTDTGKTFTDHSYDALCRSLDQSLARLGHIDLLQIHKAHAAALLSKDVDRFFERAASCGIELLGASISDPDAGQIACEGSSISAIQLPFSLAYRALEPVLDLAQERDKLIVINRPFNMGQILFEPQWGASMQARQIAAFRFILQKLSRGVVLTGTTSIDHLQVNMDTFREACFSIGQVI